MTAQVFDATPCSLGEGPLWHPEAQCLYWFDINEMRLYRRKGETLDMWQFDECVSAAGWVDETRLVVASETALQVFDTQSGDSEFLCALEADNPVTRSNDGRADPMGGFWIGTMGHEKEPGAGSIYRYYEGALRRLVPGLTIPNAISFHPDGRSACYTDTMTRKIMRLRLDADGWPEGAPEVFLDLAEAGGGPDGAVFGADGRFWIALWGAGAIAGFGPDGAEIARLEAPGLQMTCPAFGGPAMQTLFATSAYETLEAPTAMDGATFVWETPFKGQAEHRVAL